MKRLICVCTYKSKIVLLPVVIQSVAHPNWAPAIITPVKKLLFSVMTLAVIMAVMAGKNVPEGERERERERENDKDKCTRARGK